MTHLELDQVSVTAGATTLVSDACLSCAPGTTTVIVGPNGSGKSTLLRTVYRALNPDSGHVSLDGVPIHQRGHGETARVLAAMTQEHGSDFDFTVREVAATGRLPHQRSLSRDTGIDRAVVEDALRLVAMTALADRTYTTLSGGEKQRVLLARALTQQPRVLVLDEPTNHLDVVTQLALLDLVTSLGITSLIALHDLNLALRYADHLYVMADGTVAAHGPPLHVLTPALVAEVFGVRAHHVKDPHDGAPHLILGRLEPLPTSPSQPRLPNPTGALQ